MLEPIESYKWLCKSVDEAVTRMCEMFTDKYFWEDADMNLVWANSRGYIVWPLFVNDFFFSIDDVYTAMYYNIPYKCLIEWYDSSDDKWHYPVNLKNFYLYKYKKDGYKSSEEEKGWSYTTTEGIDRTPRSWSSYTGDGADLVYRGKRTIILTQTTEPVKCRSVKFSSTDDSNDEPAVRDDEDDGRKDEEVRTREFYKNSGSCGWSCKRTRGCCSAKWRQRRKL